MSAHLAKKIHVTTKRSADEFVQTLLSEAIEKVQTNLIWSSRTGVQHVFWQCKVEQSSNSTDNTTRGSVGSKSSSPSRRLPENDWHNRGIQRANCKISCSVAYDEWNGEFDLAVIRVSAPSSGWRRRVSKTRSQNGCTTLESLWMIGRSTVHLGRVLRADGLAARRTPKTLRLLREGDSWKRLTVPSGDNTPKTLAMETATKRLAASAPPRGRCYVMSLTLHLAIWASSRLDRERERTSGWRHGIAREDNASF